MKKLINVDDKSTTQPRVIYFQLRILPGCMRDYVQKNGEQQLRIIATFKGCMMNIHTTEQPAAIRILASPTFNRHIVLKT